MGIINPLSLERLFHLVNIVDHYEDALGRPYRVDDTMRKSLLEAAGLVLESENQLQEHIHFFESQSTTHGAAEKSCYMLEKEAGQNLVGIPLQLYALRSQNNWGVGDFSDLKTFIQQASLKGIGVIGLQPLSVLFPENPENAGPYAAASRLFLNPLYIDITRVEEYKKSPEVSRWFSHAEVQKKLKKARENDQVNYGSVWELKTQAFKLCFHFFLKQGTPARREAFEIFRRKKGQDLYELALFEVLSAKFSASSHYLPWWKWPTAYQDKNSSEVQSFAKKHEEDILFFQYLQWLADDQWQDVVQTAKASQVLIYKDLPIGVAQHSVETWSAPHLFARGVSIGAPADELNPKGQKWGLAPPIPWKMQENNFEVFRKILRANMDGAQILRLDHIMGLMRLFWVLEAQNKGTYISYPFEDLLMVLAEESQRQQCIIVGEDLGVVPNLVRQKMTQSKILSLKLLYFEKDKAGSFKKTKDFDVSAVVSIGTHDLPTLKGYFLKKDIELFDQHGLLQNTIHKKELLEQREESIQNLLNALEAETGLFPEKLGDFNEIIKATYAYLAQTNCQIKLIQLEDVLGQEEQVNLPGTYLEHPNWRQKLPLDIEGIFEHQGLNDVIKIMLRAQP